MAKTTYDRILEAGEDVFARLGYGTARLDHIANAVGITRAAVIHHFSSKLEIYRTVESDIFKKFLAHIEQHIKECKSNVDRLNNILEASLEYFLERPTAAAISLRKTADTEDISEDYMRYANPIMHLYKRVIEDGISNGELKDLDPMIMVNSLAGGILLYVINGKYLGEGLSYDPSSLDNINQYKSILRGFVDYFRL